MPKRITLKGLADYMTASNVRQRTLLKQFKYPDEDEARAKRLYYKEARQVIVGHHRAGKAPSWLMQHAAGIDADALRKMGRARARLEHNAAALRAYGRHFAARRFEILPAVKLRLHYGDVVVSATPDFAVREDGQEKIVKLEFGEREPSSEIVKILSQGLFEAAEQGHLGVLSSGVLLLDVRRGRAHRGARLRAMMRREIEAACQNISAVWETI